MILSKDEAQRIIKKIISYSKADSIHVSLYGSDSDNIRFAVNTVSTCGYSNSIGARITSSFGKKTGSVSISSINDDMIKAGVQKSEEIAKLSPDNEEFMPPLNPQTYNDVIEYYDSTANVSSQDRANRILEVISKAKDSNLIAAGYYSDSKSFWSIGNSNNLFGYHKNTNANFSTTMRSLDGTGSSRAEKIYSDVNILDTERLTNIVVQKCKMSESPIELPPGKYTVILESSAVADFLAYLSWNLNRRSADEGRSFFSKPEGGNKIGEKILNDNINIFSDPQFELAPSAPFSWEGEPIRKINWFEKGRLNNLHVGRYWAKKNKLDSIPFPTNIIMKGTTKTLEDLIKSTDKGILVTRLWYIRMVDPRQILITGLTRDGLFYIENGKVKHSVKNFRFNESPINVFSNVIDMTFAEKSVGSETGDQKIVVPALKVENFNFSSISDAI